MTTLLPRAVADRRPTAHLCRTDRQGGYDASVLRTSRSDREEKEGASPLGEENMRDLTQAQGDEIIRLLERIVETLDGIKDNTSLLLTIADSLEEVQKDVLQIAIKD